MTTATLRPNGTSAAANSSVSGAASVHAALSDDSDSSYIRSAGSPGIGSVVVDMGTVTLPAGAVTKQMRVRHRVGNRVAAFGCASSVNIPGSENSDPAALQVSGTSAVAIATYVSAYAAVTLSQATIDALQLTITGEVGNDTSQRHYESYIDLIYAEAPVCAITAPSGSPTITDRTSPTVSWTHTPGSDGGAQSRYEVRVFTAAEYGIGGFDPATSPASFETGQVLGSTPSILVGPLANATYRVYVRTAQTVNGAAHWSAWDFEAFEIDVSPPVIDSIVAAPDSADGRMIVTVERDVAEEDWDFIELQSSIDAGTTWIPVRGCTLVAPSDPDSWVGYDYETAPGVEVIYRARATAVLSDIEVVGPWASSNSEQWETSKLWVKALTNTPLSMQVALRDVPAPSYGVSQGAFSVLGSSSPVVVTDVRSLATGTLLIQIEDAETTEDALLALLEQTVLLVHATPERRIRPRYIAPGRIAHVPVARFVAEFARWSVDYIEVARPADDGSVMIHRPGA